MIMSTLDWYTLSREAAPGVLLGVEATTRPAQKAVRAPSEHSGDLMVGILPITQSKRTATPCVALIESRQVAELFAWLHTYSNESFPISQFCRVETSERWNSYLASDNKISEFPSAVWASIIAGEMLANAEQRLELKAIPLSWASGCFSYTIARAIRNAGRESDAVKDTATRLRTFESDSRFARRKLGVDVLSPIWGIAASGELVEGDNIREVVTLVLSVLDTDGLDLLRNNNKLLSSSAEQRIHGFDEFVDSVLAAQQRYASRGIVKVGALLASAALVVGGGTSHIELLKPYVNDFPDCLLWFGLLAGCAGPRAWDSDWLRLVKGVERQIRGGFELTDPLQGDLCWMEFDWLRQLSKSPSVFIDLAKNHNRLLTVEISPGATYQARLVAPTSEVRASTETFEPKLSATQVRHGDVRYVPQATESNEWIPHLQSISEQLQMVLGRLAHGSSDLSNGKQAPLFGDATLAKVPKKTASRAKKGTGGT